MLASIPSPSHPPNCPGLSKFQEVAGAASGGDVHKVEKSRKATGKILETTELIKHGGAPTQVCPAAGRRRSITRFFVLIAF
ncbi:MAG: hypothetical protein P9M00_10905 [Candidatus Tritonobacter lacicola]|nr:hypothetical protein [Candidatus Tritonobacter lacicola]